MEVLCPAVWLSFRIQNEEFWLVYDGVGKLLFQQCPEVTDVYDLPDTVREGLAPPF